jgi:hypothetical protein
MTIIATGEDAMQDKDWKEEDLSHEIKEMIGALQVMNAAIKRDDSREIYEIAAKGIDEAARVYKCVTDVRDSVGRLIGVLNKELNVRIEEGVQCEHADDILSRPHLKMSERPSYIGSSHEAAIKNWTEADRLNWRVKF